MKDIKTRPIWTKEEQHKMVAELQAIVPINDKHKKLIAEHIMHIWDCPHVVVDE